MPSTGNDHPPNDNLSIFRHRKIWFAIALLLASGFAVNWLLIRRDPLMDKEAVQLLSSARLLSDLAQPLGKMQPGDWLEEHYETGQTFREYLACDPVTITEERSKIYVLPLGDFSESQQQIIRLSAEFIGLYFSCDVETLSPLSMAVIPRSARRLHPSQGMRQIKSTFVLDEVLRPRLPDDAAALIAFTPVDLYPQDDWNFVYGQASLRHRVGVWSLFRNGNPETDFETVLLRTLKTATHETGHMFSMQHCTLFSCNMCGSNNRGESDRRPLHLCPECVPKLWFATQCRPGERFLELAEFCKRNDLPKSQSYFEDAASRFPN